MKYKISIIVPFYFSNKKNTSEEKNFALSSFDKCLTAIFNSKYKNYEVILVSDNSSQSSIEVAKRYPYKIIKLKKNFGLLEFYQMLNVKNYCLKESINIY